MEKHEQEQLTLEEQLALIESQASRKKGLNLEEKLKEEHFAISKIIYCGKTSCCLHYDE